MTQVRKHVRKGKNKASVVRKHKRLTHRTRNGHKEVFVDGFWKRDAYGEGPSAKWSEERLVREREKLSEDLMSGLQGGQNLPTRKYGLLTRRIKKINRLLRQKQ